MFIPRPNVSTEELNLRFAWDTKFYLKEFLAQPGYIKSSAIPYDPVRFFRFWTACLRF